MNKRLCKSDSDKKIFGVCGGIAEYFDLDPTWIRLAFCFLTLFTGVGIASYIIFAIVLPHKEKPVQEEHKEVEKDGFTEPENLPAGVCIMCGALLDEDAKFCSQCGASCKN